MSEEEVYPVKKSDWVRNDAGRVATVKDVYWLDGEVLVDLYLYDDYGEKTGRESPILGGPRTYEPSCSWENWHRITPPEFPYRIVLGEPDEKGYRTAEKCFGEKRLPDRTFVKRRRKPKVKPVTVAANANMTDEAAKLRFAATELRDMYRKTGAPDLLKRAKDLEAEAERILR